MTTQFVYYVRCQYPDSFRDNQLVSLPVSPLQFGTPPSSSALAAYTMLPHLLASLNLLDDSTMCLTLVPWRLRRLGLLGRVTWEVMAWHRCTRARMMLLPGTYVVETPSIGITSTDGDERSLGEP